MLLTKEGPNDQSTRRSRRLEGLSYDNDFQRARVPGRTEKVILGLHKARAVDDCIDAIRVFVDKQSNIGMKE